eukprot:UN27176
MFTFLVPSQTLMEGLEEILHDFGNHGPGRSPLLFDVDIKVLQLCSARFSQSANKQ